MTHERWPGYTEQSWSERFVELDRQYHKLQEQLVASTSPPEYGRVHTDGSRSRGQPPAQDATPDLGRAIARLQVWCGGQDQPLDYKQEGPPIYYADVRAVLAALHDQLERMARRLGAEFVPHDPPAPAKCPYCGNSGMVHRADGEYLGDCPDCLPAPDTLSPAPDTAPLVKKPTIGQIDDAVMHLDFNNAEGLAEYVTRECEQAWQDGAKAGLEVAAMVAGLAGRPVGAGEGDTYMTGTSLDAAKAIRAIDPSQVRKER